MSFTCSQEIESHLNEVLDSLPHPREMFIDYQSTALNLAVSAALTELVAISESFDAEFVAGTLVVFTDGDDTAGTYPTASLFNELKSIPSTLSMFSIGVGNVTEKKLAKIGRDGYVKVTNSSMLEEGFKKVAKKLLFVTQNR